MNMKVCVLGAGAMGSSIGGLLADGGAEVYLVDTWA
jgi:2-dehydropantoate 2-reductase